MLPFGIVVETTDVYIVMISSDVCREHVLDSDRRLWEETPIDLFHPSVASTLFYV